MADWNVLLKNTDYTPIYFENSKWAIVKREDTGDIEGYQIFPQDAEMNANTLIAYFPADVVLGIIQPDEESEESEELDAETEERLATVEAMVQDFNKSEKSD